MELNAATEEARSPNMHNNDEEGEPMAEEYFNQLPPRSDGSLWNDGCELEHKSWLIDLSKKYYDSTLVTIHNNEDTGFDLIDE